MDLIGNENDKYKENTIVSPLHFSLIFLVPAWVYACKHLALEESQIVHLSVNLDMPKA